MNINTRHRKKRVSRAEAIGTFILLCFTCALLWATGSFGLVSYDRHALPMAVEPRSDPYLMLKKTDPSLFNLNSFFNEKAPRFDIDVEPEFIETLNASVPTEAICRKIRYKKVPVNSILINGTEARGENWVRYRGFCFPHWLGEQKSIKVSLDKKYRGYDTVNLNAFQTDASLFDMWSGQLMSTSGGLASRIGLAELYVNGEYSGMRQMVENLDQNLARNQSIPKGMFVRELTHASLGHGINKATPYGNFNDIEAKWKKNSRKSASWDEFLDFQKSIFDGVRRHESAWEEKIDLDHYINYLAIQIITGTHHQNNHNIPVLLPGKSSSTPSGPIIPVGYDFGAPSAAIISRNVPSGEQVLGYSQNWLTDLIWSSEDKRTMIDKRVVEILLAQNPDELYSKIAERVKDLMQDEILEEHLDLIDRTEAKIHARMEVLRQGYLLPTANITPGWKTQESFQIYINGMGSFWIEFDQARRKCDENYVHASIRFGRTRKRSPLSECVDGRVKPKRVLVSETLIERDNIKHSRSHNTRFMIGGLLMTVSKGDAEFTRMDLTSNNLSEYSRGLVPKKYFGVPVKENWPFKITVNQKTKVLSLGQNAKIRKFEENGGVVTLRNISPNDRRLPFKRLSKANASFTYESSDGLAFKTLNPLLCWEIEQDSSCFEINETFLGGFKKKPVLRASLESQASNFTRENAKTCDNKITFKDQTYYVAEPLSIGQNCEVEFSPGTSFEFGPGASLVIEGPASFPNKGTVSFTGRNGGTWGGVVFVGQKQLHVQNVFMSNSTEFTWNDRYFTGALNILNVETSTIRNSIFKNIDADDGLNVRGGVSTITGNIFEKNRDGLDMDLGTGLVKGNIFLDHLDDGIDLGSAGPIDIRDNIIIGSGDKGVSVGEESNVIVSNNILAHNNIGLANKDGSIAALSGNFYRKNNIGVSVYKKNINAADGNPVDGESFFKDNNVDYKFGGENSTSLELVKTYNSDQNESDLLNQILSPIICESCADYSKSVRDRL